MSSAAAPVRLRPAPAGQTAAATFPLALRRCGASSLPRWPSYACLVLLLVLCGCNGKREKIEPRDEHEALARVNDNLDRIESPLFSHAIASFRFRDESDRDRRFIGHEAVVIFKPPRYLRFELRSLVGEVARIGSNDERYWLWIEPEVRKLWWGRWACLGHGGRRLALPPDDLLDALMMRPLPQTAAGGLRPLLRKEGDDHRLVYVRLGEDGQPTGLREVRLDPYAPYQPVEIIDRRRDGAIVMHAILADYRRLAEDGPWTARRYVVRWPLSHAELRLEIGAAEFRPDLDDSIFGFPAGWSGEVECLDEPPPGSQPARAQGAKA